MSSIYKLAANLKLVHVLSKIIDDTVAYEDYPWIYSLQQEKLLLKHRIAINQIIYLLVWFAKILDVAQLSWFRRS